MYSHDKALINVFICIAECAIVLNLNNAIGVVKIGPSLYHFMVPTSFYVVQFELIEVGYLNEIIITNIFQFLSHLDRRNLLFIIIFLSVVPLLVFLFRQKVCQSV
jgi:hypothetical protein